MRNGNAILQGRGPLRFSLEQFFSQEMGVYEWVDGFGHFGQFSQDRGFCLGHKVDTDGDFSKLRGDQQSASGFWVSILEAARRKRMDILFDPVPDITRAKLPLTSDLGAWKDALFGHALDFAC